MNLTLHNPARNFASCSCPACRAAVTTAGAANIASWNNYAAAIDRRNRDAGTIRIPVADALKGGEAATE